MTAEVFIHAGAHRTGTSSFQQCLWDNHGALHGAGYDLAYPGRDGAPGGRLRLRLPRPRHGEKRKDQFARAVAAHLAEICPDQRGKVLISEENIPGPMRHFYEGKFFPAAEKRIAALAQGIGPVAHVVYVLRPYAALYASAWRKRAEDNPVPPFADLADRFAQMDRGWPAIVSALRDGLKGARFTVLDYGQRGRSVDLLRRLVPDLTAADLTEPEDVVNLSATDAALEALQARYHAGETLDRVAWKAVLASHASDEASRGLTDYPGPVRQALETRYARDLEQIDGMEGVTFVA